MKTVTVREFYRNTGLVDELAEGKELVVTANGKPRFVVTKCSRSKISRAIAERRAVGESKTPAFNGTAFLAYLRNEGFALTSIWVIVGAVA